MERTQLGSGTALDLETQPAPEMPPAGPRPAQPAARAVRRTWGRVLHLLTSVRLAIGLLIALGVASAIGTLLPRSDVYHSPFFTLLLVALGANIAVCSARRLTTLLRARRQGVETADDAIHEHAALREQWPLSGSLDDEAERVRRALAERGLRVRSATRGGKVYLLGEGGLLSPYGPVVTHLSFLLILAGAVASSIWGWAGEVEIPEGSSADAVELAGGRAMPLGFEVRCDDFQMKTYAGTGQPEEFRSDLVVLEQGREVLKKTIRVNDPLSYGGLTFYQSNYGLLPPDAQGGRLIFAVRGSDGKQASVAVTPGKSAAFGDGLQLLVRQFFGNFRLDSSGRPSEQPGLENPAALVAVLKDGRVMQEGWRFARYPDFESGTRGPWSVQLADVEGREYTGLRVSYDPGVGLVFAGGGLLSLGLMLSFLQRQRRIWARLEPFKSRLRLSLAARALRHGAALEPEFAGLVERLRPAPAPLPALPVKKNRRSRP
jgi:cytochrome c biogenesis protein